MAIPQLEIGKFYYFKEHAYYHYIGKVACVLATNRVALTDVSQIHSCGRCWTEFFRDGPKGDTRYDSIPDSPSQSFISCYEWAHGPLKRKERA